MHYVALAGVFVAGQRIRDQREQTSAASRSERSNLKSRKNNYLNYLLDEDHAVRALWLAKPTLHLPGRGQKKKKEFRDRDSSREGRGRQQVAGLDGHNGIIRCTTLAVGAAQDEEVQARRGRRTELRKACFC